MCLHVASIPLGVGHITLSHNRHLPKSSHRVLGNGGLKVKSKAQARADGTGVASPCFLDVARMFLLWVQPLQMWSSCGLQIARDFGQRLNGLQVSVK